MHFVYCRKLKMTLTMNNDSFLEPNCQDESERMCRSNKSIMSYVTSSSNAAEEVADHHDYSISTTSCSGRRLNTEGIFYIPSNIMYLPVY